jgi:prevent-host-death family protein
MREQEPVTRTMKISEVKNALSRVMTQDYRKETRVLVEKSGIPVAAIISMDDLERFDRLEREREERFAVIDRMREAFADVPPEEIEQEAERSVAEARERLRQRTSAARSA